MNHGYDAYSIAAADYCIQRAEISDPFIALGYSAPPLSLGAARDASKGTALKPAEKLKREQLAWKNEQKDAFLTMGSIIEAKRLIFSQISTYKIIANARWGKNRTNS